MVRNRVFSQRRSCQTLMSPPKNTPAPAKVLALRRILYATCDQCFHSGSSGIAAARRQDTASGAVVEVRGTRARGAVREYFEGRNVFRNGLGAIGRVGGGGAIEDARRGYGGGCDGVAMHGARSARRTDGAAQ